MAAQTESGAILTRSSTSRGIFYSLVAEENISPERNKARVSALVSGGRVALDADSAGGMGCDPLKARLRTDIAYLALPLTGRISVGKPWSDSLVYAICVAGIPGQAQSWRRFDATGDTTLAGGRAIIIVRRDSIAARASGTFGQHLVSLDGAGRATARIYLSESSGMVVRVWKEQLLDIAVRSDGRTRAFVQRSTSVAEIAR